MSNKFERRYGLFTAICLVVGIVIGSGVFFKAQEILEKTGGNMPLGIVAWIIGGMVMLSCILAFSLMAQKYEKVNGVVDYAEATLGKSYAYLIGWFMNTFYYPTLTMALAWLSARYTLVFITSVNPDFPLLIPASEGGCFLGPECMVLTLLFLVLAFSVNALSPKVAGKLQVSTTIIKLFPLALMAVGGIIYGMASGGLAHNFTTPASVHEVVKNPLLASVCSSAFAYEGWIIATSINAELKNSKRNLPIALISGCIIIICVYVLYFIGVAGGATNQELIDFGATVAFTNLFGNVLGNILNLFIAISCIGTLNGLMLGCSRGAYSLAVRNEGPSPHVFKTIDENTNMATNSSVFGLVCCAVWFVYFYLSNLSRTWSGFLVFDPTELPILTMYAFYIPIFISWSFKAKEENVLRRFIIPILAAAASAFMIYATVLAHGIACIWYLIVFIVFMLLGVFLKNPRRSEK
ncbi:MAG: APC family permease [Oscillospiraceae bacterium]|nr:APC family permease [Oscillospiraceae bacterium]MBQ6901844.1 APC family permease [Oscillospiraceae bacterium]